MSKFEGLIDQFDSYTEKWEGKSGNAVEDFITRKLEKNDITNLTYEGSTLSIIKADGDKVSTTVTVETPEYKYGVYIYGIRTTDRQGVQRVHSSGQSITLQYIKDQTTVELGIALYAVAVTSYATTDRVGPFKTKITYGTKSGNFNVSNIPFVDCISDSAGNVIGVVGTPDEILSKISWVDTTSLFTVAQRAQNISIVVSDSPATTAKFAIPVNTEVLNLTYAGNYIVNTNIASFNLTGASGTYQLEVYNNGNPTPETIQSMQYPNLVSGLNAMMVRAVNVNDPSIYTDWLGVNIICTVDCNNTVVAVNGVTGSIPNNGVATLYDLYVYSPRLEEVELTTYLENEVPNDANPQPTQIMKYEVINASLYSDDFTYNTKYKKYIELPSNNASQYLLIKANDVFQKFYLVTSWGLLESSYQEMVIEPINPDLTYYSASAPNLNFDQIVGASNNVLVTETYATASNPANISPYIEPSNGWVEQDGRTLFRISAQGNPILTNPLPLGLTPTSTIELGFKTYNISNKDIPILTMGKFQLRPMQFCWDADPTTSLFTARNSQFQEGVETHLMITIQKGWYVSQNDIYYPDMLPGTYKDAYDKVSESVKVNLVRVFINGVIDREISLTDDEIIELQSAALQINPTTADIDLYLFRVYNTTALNFNQVQSNYISFLSEKTQKLSFFDKNDILNADGVISYEKCLGKYNTLVLVTPNFLRVPNITWNVEDPSEDKKYKKVGSTLFLNYADPELNNKYGGRLTHGQIKGQGSSAKRYLWWNLQFALNKLKDSNDKKIKSKFTPYSQMDPETNLFKEDASSVSGYYNMPPYSGQADTTEYKYTKLVGKINFASSMQSHKQGACKLFDDAYKAPGGVGSLYSGGRKAVHEEAFLYFYWETDLEDVSNIQLADLLANPDNIKFAGFQTFGPGKGDDACSGYDEDITPEYLIMEGGENKDPSVNFRVPWMALQRGDATKYGTADYKLTDVPTVTYQESLEEPWKNLLIDDESVVYASAGAWDIDYGCYENEDDYAITVFEFDKKVRPSLKVFREFYDFVYKYTFNLIDVTGITSPQPDWDVTMRYVIEASTFSLDGTQVATHQVGDMYRYEEYSGKWVPAGLEYNATTGWSRLNLYELSNEIAANSPKRFDVAVNNLKSYFTANVTKYIHLQDIAYHQAFIKLVSGTDNRAKNTYFQIIGPLYEERDVIGEDGQPVLNEDGEVVTEFVKTDKGDQLIRLIGDDLDTILVTDNNGLQSKPYNLLEASYDMSMKEHWGDANNAFLYMFDQSFEGSIKTFLKHLLTYINMDRANPLANTSYFYKAFFSIQETYPAVAYNHTAKLWYENAHSILNSNVLTTNYANNGVAPLEQSHGSCLQCEAQFMKERLNFLLGYAQSLGVDNINFKTAAGTGGSGIDIAVQMEFEPYQDFYPNYFWANGVRYFFTTPTGQFDAIAQRVQPGNQYSVEIKHTDQQINQGLFFIDLFKKLKITGLKLTELGFNGDRMVNFYSDNADIANNSDFFGSNHGELSLAQITASMPVLEEFSLRNMTLPTTVNCEEFNKLRSIDFTGSTTDYVVFPQSGNLTHITIPAVKTFRIYNNPSLQNVIIEGYENLQTIYIDCSKCGNFDVSQFLPKILNSPLVSVDLRNCVNLEITEETLSRLLQCPHCYITGSIKVVTQLGSETLKAISFATKQQLVNLFGDIDTPSSTTYVQYESLRISSISGPTEVSVFGVKNQWYGGLFPINITTGNDVKIIQGINPTNPDLNAYLDITYSMVQSGGDNVNLNNIAEINTQTGAILLKKEDESCVATVTISVGTKTSVARLTHTVQVRFAWKAPAIGDFAYADGSFSGAYDKNKTLVGLVYAKQPTSDISGTVYIIGKEFTGGDTQSYYLGYSNDGVDRTQAVTGTDGEKQVGLYELQQWLVGNSLSTYDNVTAVSNANKSEIINSDIKAGYFASVAEDDSSNDKSIANFTGKADTLAYVQQVNNQLLHILPTEAQRYITQDENGYSISTLNNLNILCDRLDTYMTSLTEQYALEYCSSLLYPYFYSAYLYEPEVKSNEALDQQYSKGNWYMPSVTELARVLYYKGYSVGGDSFIESDISATTVGSISQGDSDYTVPIFSLALNRMGQLGIWEQMYNNNIATTQNSGENYSFTNYSINSQQLYQWIYGTFSVSGWSTLLSAQERVWRLTKHKGIPFTQFNYQKQS